MLGGGSLGTAPTVLGKVLGKGKERRGKTDENKQLSLQSQDDWSVYRVFD